MAERKIIRGVRMSDKTYVPGMEGELEKAISAEEVKRLTAKGYLEGTWAAAPAAPKPVTKEK